jgi:PAS domain S-box-containing protein
MSRPVAPHFQKPAPMNSIALPSDASQSLASTLFTFRESIRKFLYGERVRVFGTLVVVSVAYFLVAKLSLELRFGGSTKAALWPPNAILASALLLAPLRRGWMYLLAVIPAHIAVHWPFHIGALWLCLQIGHNTILAILGAGILKRWEPKLSNFDRLHDVLVFLGVAILVPGFASLALVTAVSTICTPEVIQAHGWSTSFWHSWSRIWLTNSVSFLVFVPVILLLVTRGILWTRRLNARQYAEAFALGCLLLATGYLIFGSGYASATWQPAAFLIPLPLLLWAAIRFGSAGNSLAVFGVVCVSFWRAYRGDGPFMAPESIAKVESMQLFWILLTVPLMPLAAMIQEHKLALRALAESENRFRQLFEQAPVGVVLESPEGKLEIVNPAMCAMLGYSEAELHQMSCEELSHPEDKASEGPLFQELCDGQRQNYQIDKRFFRKDGSLMWGRVSVALLHHGDGDRPYVIGMLKDISALKLRDQELATLSGRLIQAQEEERRRISRELHDDIGQQAAAIASDSLALKQMLAKSPKDTGARLADALSQMSSELATSIHKLSHELHSSRLRYLGLASALKELCDKLASQHAVHIDLNVECGAERLPEQVELCLYRVAQEALNNVIKHSNASTAAINVCCCKDSVALTVSDDGMGFETNLPPAGIGLTSMRERLRMLGGELTIRSSPDWGSEIRAEIALPAPKALAARA